MTGALLRTSTIPFHRHTFTASRKQTLRNKNNDVVFSPPSPRPGIRRSVSDTNIFISGSSRIPAVRSFSSGIMETDEQVVDGGIGNGRRYGGDGRGAGGGGREDRGDIGEYYQRMLRNNPADSLLLRNYGKYLHEVEKDTVRAEECYGRAILASPGDGELLSLYGNLLWETHRDGERAKSYFDQAIRAAPNDSTVLGSYAHFMWEAEEEEDEQVGIKTEVTAANGGAVMGSPC